MEEKKCAIVKDGNKYTASDFDITESIQMIIKEAKKELIDDIKRFNISLFIPKEEKKNIHYGYLNDDIIDAYLRGRNEIISEIKEYINQKVVSESKREQIRG